MYCRHVGKLSKSQNSGYKLVLDKLIERLQLTEQLTEPLELTEVDAR